MPSSNLPPEEQPEVKPFDPLVLDRTVIAVPLLKEMQEDLELTAKVEIPQEFNAAIEFNGNFSGGATAAREQGLKMVDRAKDRALEASTKRLESAEKDSTGREETACRASRGNRQANYWAAGADGLQFRLGACRNYPAPSCRE
jgi:hypothetical protein